MFRCNPESYQTATRVKRGRVGSRCPRRRRNEPMSRARDLRCEFQTRVPLSRMPTSTRRPTPCCRKDDGAIILWWDETEGGARPAPPDAGNRHLARAKSNAYTNNILYTPLVGSAGHAGDLRRGPVPAHACNATDLSDLFVAAAIPEGIPEPATLSLLGFSINRRLTSPPPHRRNTRYRSSPCIDRRLVSISILCRPVCSRRMGQDDAGDLCSTVS